MPTDVTAITAQALFMLQDASRAATNGGLAGLAVVAMGDQAQDLEAVHAGREAARFMAEAADLIHAAQARLEAVLTASALETGRLATGRRLPDRRELMDNVSAYTRTHPDRRQ